MSKYCFFCNEEVIKNNAETHNQRSIKLDYVSSDYGEMFEKCEGTLFLSKLTSDKPMLVFNHVNLRTNKGYAPGIAMCKLNYCPKCGRKF